MFFATELELNSKTVTSVIQMYKKTGRVEAKRKRQPKNKKITPEATEFIKRTIDENVSVTLATLRDLLVKQFNIHATLPTVNPL